MMEQARTMGRVVVMTALTLAVLGAMLVQAATPAQAAFPGKNGKIVFSSNRTTGSGVDNPEGDYEIFTMKSDGTSLKQLTKNNDLDEDPAYSADGQRIAFTSHRDGNFEIYKMNGDGTAQVRLTNNSGSDSDPAWSPNGQQIAFQTDRTGDYEIFKMSSLNGSGLTNLTNNSAFNSYPSWSPNGQQIAFASNQGSDTEIYRMSASNGSNQIRLTENLGFHESPNWSPNGQQIVFARPGGIFKMKALDGSGQTQVTTGGVSPAWSPDGQQIVFRGADITKVNIDGTGVKNLAKSPADDRDPDWQPKPSGGLVIGSYLSFARSNDHML